MSKLNIQPMKVAMLNFKMIDDADEVSDAVKKTAKFTHTEEEEYILHISSVLEEEKLGRFYSWEVMALQNANAEGYEYLCLYWY